VIDHPTKRRPKRIKIGATLDASLLHEVDAYVAQHPGLDRSAVIDQALSIWYAAEQRAAMEKQFEPEEADPDREDWRSISRAAAARRFLDDRA